MKKMLKINSVLLAVCIAFSMLSGAVFASEEAAALSVIGWNADSDFITIDLSHKADLTSLTSGTALTLDGKAVAVDVAYSRHADTDNLFSAETLMERYTYIIKPTGGMKLDKIYKLTLSNVAAADESVAALASYTKLFKVEKIDEDMQFVITGSSATATWRTNYGYKDTRWTLSAAENNTQIVAESLGSSTGLNFAKRLKFNDKGNLATDTADDRNYTMKAVFDIDSSAVAEADIDDNEVTVGLGSHVNEYSTGGAGDLDDSSNTAVHYAVSMYTNSDSTQNAAAMKLTQASTESGVKAAKTVGAYNDLFTEDTVELKLAYKDGKATGFLNGVKTADGSFTEYTGFPAIKITSTKAGNVITISGYVLTQAVECYEASIDKAVNAELSDTVKVTLPKAITAAYATKDYIKLMQGETEVTDYSMELLDDSKTVAITYSGLENRTKYTVELSGIVFDGESEASDVVGCVFETVPAAFELQYLTVYDANDDEINDMSELTTDTFTAKALVANNLLDEPQSFTAALCIYNSKGQMCKVTGGAYELEKGETAPLTAAVNCEEDTTYYVKCFVWDSYTGMNTIFEKEIN